MHLNVPAARVMHREQNDVKDFNLHQSQQPHPHPNPSPAGRGAQSLARQTIQNPWRFIWNLAREKSNRANPLGQLFTRCRVHKYPPQRGGQRITATRSKPRNQPGQGVARTRGT